MSVRRTELDYCRIVACVMVVFLHMASWGWFDFAPDSFEWKVYNFYDMMVRGAVPVFFMISGALFLNREALDIRRLLGKNVPHLILVYVFWSVFYAAADMILQKKEFSLYQFALLVVKGRNHMWFLTAMLTAYLFLPVIYGAIHGKKLSAVYVLFLFGVYAIVTNHLQLIPHCPEIIVRLGDKLSLTNVRYVGYMVLGYYLSNKSWGDRWKVICPVVYVIVGCAATLANQWYSIKMGKPVNWLYDYFAFPALIFAVCIFIFFQCYRQREFKKSQWASTLSVSTLGVYLLHPFLMSICSYHGISVSKYPAAVSVPVAWMGMSIFCFIVITVLRKIPILRKCME